jgi:large conductance mechanosensitive channel
MAAKKSTAKKPTTKSAELKDIKADVKLARADAIKARAEAARARAATIGGSPLGGFVTFIREKGVVGLAVGLAIGTAATGVVTQIVNAVITPTVSLLIGEKGLKGLNFVVRKSADGTPTVVYAIGDLIDALIKFLAVAAVIYFVVMGLKLDKLDKKKE